MKPTLLRALARTKTTLSEYTVGQKISAAIGAVALLIGAALLVRWVTAPDYTVLYSNLSGSDASSVVDQLDKQSVQYKLTDGGSTVLVPKNVVYSTRVKLAGEGIPNSDEGGYSILDKESISTSEFQEKTDYKRAMEGELAKTIEAMNGVQTAVVHLAIPDQSAFSDTQQPTTASVLVKTDTGQSLGTSQVQAIVNIVSSSVEGLKANQVTVADANGNVLSVAGDGTGASTSTVTSDNQQVANFQNDMTSQVQKLLDTVVGPGNSAVNVTANLDFDATKTKTTRYFYDKTPPLSSQTSKESYKNGSGSGTGSSGVVGSDGQLDNSGTTSSTGTGDYNKSSTTEDNSVGSTVEDRVAAPGGVNSLHIGVVLNQKAKSTVGIQNQVYDLLKSSVGIDAKRGDTINVSTLAFDTTTQATAAKELAAQQKAETRSHWISVGRNVLLVLAIGLALLIGMRRMKKREAARQKATEVLVQQLRSDKDDDQEPAMVAAPAMSALEQAEHNEDEQIREEIAELVEQQPEEVASLLRGWLVEKH